jgi:predicted phosphate transport protein (TIGR00153 family)
VQPDAGFIGCAGKENKIVGWREFFKPRQDKFLELLIRQAETTLQGMDALELYMKKCSETHAASVVQAEKEADEVRRILIDDLNRTFVTPIDREDIFALSRAIDDVMDYAYTTVEEMRIFEVEPNDFLRRMVSLLQDAAGELHLAMLRLKENPGVASEHASRAKALENRVERVYREAVADLFSGPEDIHHVMEMLKLREIYRHLSNCADRGDEAANVIHDIVVKMT